MISYEKGDIFDADVEALVNAVNCSGVMGAGLALEFKDRWPKMFRAYREACDSRNVTVGKIHVWPTQKPSPRFILNFPTKRLWRERSHLDYVRDGLEDLVDVVESLSITSIAIPALGCGLGGLAWKDVRPLIAKKFSPLYDVKTLIYEPKGG